MKTGPLKGKSMTLDELTARLSRHEIIDGILIMGSGSRNHVTPASDYDLLVVLSDVFLPAEMVVTWVGQRLTEVYFTAITTIDRILTVEDLKTLTEDVRLFHGTMLAWIETGRIVLDRSARLEHAKGRVRAEAWFKPEDEREIYSAWWKINYNVQQTKRMLASKDHVYLTAVDIRLLYTLHELWWNYFRLRSLRSQGEKADIRYLATNDPVYLEIFRECLAETDRERKFALYEQLARMTLAPVGELWEDGMTAVLFDLQTSTVDKALQFWEGLIRDNDTR